jgi:hypothetical protein
MKGLKMGEGVGGKSAKNLWTPWALNLLSPQLSACGKKPSLAHSTGTYGH